MKQPKLYYFMMNSHHYLISRIDKDSYGIFDLCTIRYTDDRWKTLKQAIKGAKKYYKTLHIFDTYRELFECMIKQEIDYNFIDVWKEKDLVERESLHTKKRCKEFLKEYT